METTLEALREATLLHHTPENRWVTKTVVSLSNPARLQFNHVATYLRTLCTYVYLLKSSLVATLQSYSGYMVHKRKRAESPEVFDVGEAQQGRRKQCKNFHL